MALLAAACTSVRPAQALPSLDLVLTPQGGGVFHYELAIHNSGPEDLVLVTITDAPLADPLIDPTLAAPVGFLALYDSGLGFVDALEDTALFAAGTTVSGFSWDSTSDPRLFFSQFTALSDLGASFSGTINRIGFPSAAVPDSAPGNAMLSLALFGLFFVRARLGLLIPK